MGGRSVFSNGNFRPLGNVEKYDVNGNLTETLPLLRIHGYRIYLIASKESPNLMYAN